MQPIDSSARRVIRKWLLETAMPGRSVNYADLPRMSRNCAKHLFSMAREQKTLSNLLSVIEEHGADEPWADIFQKCQADRRLELVTMARLKKLGEAILSECSSSRLTIVKGPSFADRIYPQASLRAFTDIDILVAPDAVEALAESLEQQGFEFQERTPPVPGHPEQQYLHREFPNLLVETHTDVVHSKRLRETIRLTYDDVADAPQAPSTQLLVALAHGFVVNQYKQIGNIVDVVLAARNIDEPEDMSRIEHYAGQRGNRVWLYCGLITAGRILDDDRCIELGRQLGGGRLSGLSAKIIKNQLVPTKIAEQNVQRWTRKMVRLLMIRQARKCLAANGLRGGGDLG